MSRRVQAATFQWQAHFSRSQVHVTIPVFVVCNLAHGFSSRQAILAFTIPTLLGFLQIQSVGNGPSIFQLYPVTTRSSVFCVLAYYLAFGAKLWLPTYASQLAIAMSVFGSFAVASLGSLLLPRSFCYILYVIFMVAELHRPLRRIYDKIVQRLLHRRRPRMRMARRLLPQTSMDLRVSHTSEHDFT